MADAETPNLFNLHGKHLTVTFSTTGIDGRPHLSYHDAHRSMQFSGDDIAIVPGTPLGTLVSVPIVEAPDLGTTTFTVLLPTVNLDPGTTTHISTEGITTIHRSSFAPQLDRGQIESYTATALTGTAQLVDF